MTRTDGIPGTLTKYRVTAQQHMVPFSVTDFGRTLWEMSLGPDVVLF